MNVTMRQLRPHTLILVGWLAAGQVLAMEAAEQPAAEPAPANRAQLEWWSAARFGMFIHWGPVSLKGTEIGWSRGDQVPIEEYDQLYKRFNPVQFNADAWVKVAKDAGMKYLVFTTKHHDGFCMFDTDQTDFNIMQSPFARDVVKELAEACRSQDIGFGTYYSVCDWHHPDFTRGSPGGKTRKPTSNLDRYEQYLRRQVAELIGKYGPLRIMWFDVAQDFDAPRGKGVVDFVRSLQPDIIVNNRCANPGDYDTPEQRIGDFNRDQRWETCMTLGTQWAWKPGDSVKPLPECVQTLLRIVGGDGNLLLNVGPTADGCIEPEQAQRLREMGAWLAEYGAGVYGTRGGPFKPGSWGASTCQGKHVYLFVMNWPEAGPLQLPPLPLKIVAGQALSGGPLSQRQTDQGITVNVPPSDRQPIATVIRLTVDGQADEIPAISFFAKDDEEKGNAQGGQGALWSPADKDSKQHLVEFNRPL